MGFFPPFHVNAGDRRNMDYQSQNALHGTRLPRRRPCRSHGEQVAGLGWAELGPRRKESAISEERVGEKGLREGFSLTLDHIFARKNVSSPTSSNKEVVMKNDQNNGGTKPVQNFTTIPITQALNYNLSKEGHLEKEPWNAFSHHGPVNVSIDGIPCILFWVKRITIKFKNQTWLDLTDEAFGQKVTVDPDNSNCTEESARLSLKLGDAGNPRSLAMRFILTNCNRLSIQSWFSLRRVEIVSNNSFQAVFNPSGIYAPSGYSYRCQRVGNLPRDQALLLPGNTADGSSLWEVTLTDFQIQGFAIKGGRFTKARDCASSFSPAILIGLAMSLILLLVLAYALHMLIYLRYLDRHYNLITSPAHFPQLKARDTADEKELLRSQGAECYELRSQQISKIYV
ncbi:PREDICTED: V-type proton ATPase subunit S1-like protein isoform X3 [Rhinopithecus bieti]|uniref:V-type proton ATPase subunit S1-like protein isoform X3 n=1 Tax=Rhinopithecus bieti TaxID=61621 RepID=UPI00083BEE83|nr:PREDICTED: V-type proton ATPase subunit S1-like protein isoform X3 [Rhinopithecus bieti]